MISEVQQADLYNETGNLSGENAVTIGGSSYTIATRNTSSGEAIQKATQYVYERLTAIGLTASYHNWSGGSFAGRNVVGVKAGTAKPDEIVLVTCHLDDMPESGAAPGADDNGSGSAALLIAAEALSSGTFERTLRFAFFTGEEQGLYGSDAYADAAKSADENIVAVYNMDMIGYSTGGSPATLRLHTRLSSAPGYASDMIIANTFSDVVSTYSLSSHLTPAVTSDGETASDHSSFWYYGYPAILAIEDDIGDFNPYYHTTDDMRQRLNMTYFTNFTKASVGTAAHLAIPAGAPATRMLKLLNRGDGTGTVASSPAGIDCGSTCSATFAMDTPVTLTAVPSTGSAFASWSGGCSGTSPTCVVSMSSDVTVTAAFNLVHTKEFKLAVSRKKAGGGDGTITSADGMIECGSTCSELYSEGALVTLTASALGDSTFTGWSGACTGKSPCGVTMDRAQRVTATFVGPQKLTVRKQNASNGTGTVESNPEGINCGTSCPSAFAFFPLSEKVTLTATPAPDSVFYGWSPKNICPGADPCEVTMDRAKGVTAKFIGPQTLTVRNVSVKKGTGSVTSVPGGISCGSGVCKAPFMYNGTVVLSAEADEGSVFSGWSPKNICPGTDPCEVTMDRAKGVTAKFAKE